VPDRVQIDTTLVRQNRAQNHAFIGRHRLLNRTAVACGIYPVRPPSGMATGTSHRTKAMGLIILLVVLILLFGGGRFYYGPPYHYYGGGLGLVLLIVVLVLLFRGKA
jgi:hypothetical protein